MKKKRNSFFRDIFNKLEKCYLDKILKDIVMSYFDKVIIE